jgi:hypothetical protein
MNNIPISVLFLSVVAVFFSCSVCFDTIFDYCIVVKVIIKIVPLIFFIFFWYFFCCVLAFYYGFIIRRLFPERNPASYWSVILSWFYYLWTLCLAGLVICIVVIIIIISNGNYWLERYTIYFEKPVVIGIPIIFFLNSIINFFVISISYKSIIGLLCNFLWAISSIASAITLTHIMYQI